MYSTCLFCHAGLGANEVVEPFPIGRRLAFDSSKGRLWVVCASCERWNLTPLEERWEAIDACERLFRDTRLRASTDNVGLARLPEGLELVRVGAPRRPELAAWRYGRELLRRQRVYGAPAKALTGALAALGIAHVLGAPALITLGGGFATVAGLIAARDGVGSTDVALAEGRRVSLGRRQLGAASILGDDREGWALRVPHDGGVEVLSGDPARRAVSVMLARLNRVGGTAEVVRQSVEHLERVGSPEEYFRRIGRLAGGGGGIPLEMLTRDISLGLEMATHEESERRALEGELAALESAWRDAEEIAAIADSLLVPARVTEWIAARRGRA